MTIDERELFIKRVRLLASKRGVWAVLHTFMDAIRPAFEEQMISEKKPKQPRNNPPPTTRNARNNSEIWLKPEAT